MKRLISFILIVIMAISAGATISGEDVTTTYSSEYRIPVSTNATINISFTESTSSNYVNFTFPAGFLFGALINSDMENSTVIDTITKTGGTNIYINYSNASAGFRYFNFTANVTTPSTNGNKIITFLTNSSTGGSVTLFVRDTTLPYYLEANNTNYTIVSESWTDTGTTLTTSGQGNTNMTIAVPVISGEVNISRYGYTATNAKMVRISNTSGYMYIIPDPDVSDPVIIITQSTSMAETNLPIALSGAGVIAVVYIIYRFKKRTR